MNKPLFDEVTKFFTSLPRQGVGSPPTTVKALDFIPHIKNKIQIVDMGCGTGGQTIELLNNSRGTVTAIDRSQPSLDRLQTNAEIAGCSSRLKTICEDMNSIEFPVKSIDLIWSEGSIYTIGFEHGLKRWSSFLKSGGYIAVNDCNWLTNNPSSDSRTFWNSAYPAMTTIEEAKQIAEGAGFTVEETFVQPESDWWDLYYNPMRKLINTYREIDNIQLPSGFNQFLDGMDDEIVLRTDHSSEYNYVFYILQKSY